MAEEPELQFSRDEDLERAKAFWKENGRSIIAGIILGLAAIGGYNGWQWWQKSQGETASTLYENMQQADISSEAADDLLEDLQNDYGTTTYASMASLTKAKRAVDSGDLDAAAEPLRWILANSPDEAIKHVARLRLAMVLLGKQDANAALALIDSEKSMEFSARYAELRGDAHVLKNDLASARIAYEESREALPAGSANAGLLQLKLDSLGSQ